MGGRRDSKVRAGFGSRSAAADELDALPPAVRLQGLKLLGRQELELLLRKVGLVGTMRRICTARKIAAQARAESSEPRPPP